MTAPRVLFLGHAAERTGPPIILLDILRWLRANTPIEVGVLLQEGGPLMDAYRRLGPAWIAPHWLEPGPTDLAVRGLSKFGLERSSERLRLARLRLPARGIGDWPLVYVNTAGCARLLPLVPTPPRRVIAHVHELSTGLDFHIEPAMRQLLFDRADRIITVADAVTDEVVSMGLAPRSRITTIHGCVEPPAPVTEASPTRADLGIPEDAFVVGSSGLRHWRKAPDLFVSLARRMVTGHDDPWFVWVGGEDADPAGRAALADVERAGLGHRVRFVPHQASPRDWFRLFDVFALTAREDAFPLVGLEAASVNVPVVCFTAGGLPEFVRDDAGVVVTYPDIDAMAAVIDELRHDPPRRERLGRTAAERVRQDHSVATAAARIAQEINAVWSS
jgi:glycosyltransferase involved in cell wall biosynthesis